MDHTSGKHILIINLNQAVSSAYYIMYHIETQTTMLLVSILLTAIAGLGTFLYLDLFKELTGIKKRTFLWGNTLTRIINVIALLLLAIMYYFGWYLAIMIISVLYFAMCVIGIIYLGKNLHK